MGEIVPEEEIVWEIWDRIPDDLALWAHGDELAAGHFTDRTYDWWRTVLGHSRGSHGCCATCGCATSCTLSVFHEAVAVATIRELMRQGLLNIDAGTGYSSVTDQETGSEDHCD